MSKRIPSKAKKRDVIDSQGRVFGVVNIIDALVLACLLSLAPALYYGYRLVNQPPPPPSSAPPQDWVTVKGYMYGMTVEALAQVSPGDVMMSGGEEVAQIMAVRASDVVMTGERTVVARLKCVQKARNWMFNGQPVKIGLRLAIIHDEWEGMLVVQEYRPGLVDPQEMMPRESVKIEDVEDAENAEDAEHVAGAFQVVRQVEVRLVSRGLLPQVARSFRKGEEWVLPRTRSSLRILDCRIEPESNDPTLERLHTQVLIDCIEIDGRLFFGLQELKIGQAFSIETSRSSISGTIVDFQIQGSGTR